MLIGMNEMIIILTLITMTIYSYLYIKSLKRIDSKIFFLWIVLGISLSMVVFCPGNHKRDGIYQNNHNINFTFGRSSELFIEKVIDWIPSLLVLTTAIILLLNIRFKFRLNIGFKLVLLGILVFFVIFFSMYLPPTWHLGNSYNIPGRTINVILFYSQIVTLFFTIYLVNKFNLKELNIVKSPFSKVFFIIIIIMILSGRNNFKNVVKDITTGDAKKYYVQNMCRLNQIQENKMDTIKVKALIFKPKTLYCDDFAKEADNWLNIGIAKVMKSKPIIMEE
jgi:succinate dehydrogenase hydrophobic anchor subunit